MFEDMWDKNDAKMSDGIISLQCGVLRENESAWKKWRKSLKVPVFL